MTSRSPAMISAPSSIPATELTTMNRAVLARLDPLIAASPPAASPAPTSPPTSACEEEVGNPRCQEV